ncbi:MAG: methyl-accepting chemotaxis protein [Vicinamibacteraceae bacterium]|nr:methyl-accepting chemotaxis protein [Vicinamibacteraceae bacterium]
MTRLSIRTRLTLLVLLTAVSLALLRYDGFHRTRRMAETMTALYEEQVVPMQTMLELRERVRNQLLDVPTQVRLGLMTPPQAHALVERAAADVQRVWERYKEQATSPRQRQVMVRLDPVVAQAGAAGARLQGTLAGGSAEAIDDALRDAHPIVTRFDAEVEQAERLVRDDVDRQYRTAQADYERGLVWSAVWVGLSLLLVTAFGWTIRQSVGGALTRVTRQLRELTQGRADLSARIPVEQQDEVGRVATAFNQFMEHLQGLLKNVETAGLRVTSSSSQVSASTRLLETTMAQQLAATSAVEATAHQIASTAASLSGTMQEISRRAEDAQALAQRGVDGLRRIGGAMGGMEAATSSVSDRLATINAKAANITGVVTTITKVADQTNLLSLNASIEAVKAGEVGHGFGVVAQEIRRLADQTAVATLDIEQIVKEMQAAVASGVMGMDKLAEQVREAVEEVSRFSVELRRGIEDVNTLIARFGSVNEGMASQSAGASEISLAVSQLSTGATETSQALKESMLAVAALNETARELEREVSRFGTA